MNTLQNIFTSIVNIMFHSAHSDSRTLVKRRRWPRFSLRVLLIAMGVLGIGLGLFGRFWQRLQHQRRIVALIESAGGSVRYDYQLGVVDFYTEPDTDIRVFKVSANSDGSPMSIRVTPEGSVVTIETPPGPKIVRRLFGDDAFAHVENVSFLSFREPTTKVDPRLLLELPRLKLAELTDAQINDETLTYIAKLPKLRALMLIGDKAGSATNAGIGRLKEARQLETLGVSGSWVQDKDLAGIAGLSRLTSLQFSNCDHITSAVFPNMREMTKLQELYIFRANQIDDRNLEHLRELKNLKKLTLSGTSIGDDGFGHLAGHSHMEWLDMSETNIGDNSLALLSEWNRLKFLNLRKTRVSDAGLHALSRLPKLIYLKLGETNLTDAGLPAVARMTQLQQLNLFPSSISDNGLLRLKTLKNLNRLEIGPHITKEGANELRQALPGCEVVRYDEKGHASFPED